jgi:predicted TPR repeat methyltransferase
MIPAWRRALPRLGLDESTDLPVVRLAERLSFAGERGAAVEAYREHVEGHPEDLEALEKLAAVLGRLGRTEEELSARRELAVKVSRRLGVAAEHDEAVIEFEMASIGAAEAPGAVPAAYVAATFDQFADRFDHELRDRLSYRGPEQIAERLGRLFGERRGSLDVCDAGCGTGLLGPLLRPFARTLVGVDLSPRMLEKAGSRGVYDELWAAELTAYLESRPGSFDVVTAADVFVYIGDLRPVLAAMGAALRPGGAVFFSVERATEGTYDLQANARYAHSIEHVRAAAAEAGLREVSIEQEVLRKERLSPVYALICAFVR